jgi:hypothetical protein
MADPIGDDTPVTVFAHPRNPTSPGRQMLNRLLSSGEFDKLLRLIRKRSLKGDGFRKSTSGISAAILGLLRDPRTREEFLRLAEVSLEEFRSEEDCARSLAVGLVIGDWAQKLDYKANERLDQFWCEMRRAIKLRVIGEGYEEDAQRHARKARDHLKAPGIASGSARYVGRCLERDFGGLRAPKCVADLVNCAFNLKRKTTAQRPLRRKRPLEPTQLTEHQVRYLCGWIKRRA